MRSIPSKIVIEQDFTNEVNLYRAVCFWKAAIKKIDAKIRGNCLERIKVGIVFLLVQDVFQLMQKNIYDQVALNDPERTGIGMEDIYRWVAMRLFPSSFDLIIDKALDEVALRNSELRQCFSFSMCFNENRAVDLNVCLTIVVK